MHALNGGAVGYSDVYMSTMHDDSPTDTVHNTGMMSAVRALALYGSGGYLGRPPVFRESCPLSFAAQPEESAKQETNDDTKDTNSGDDDQLPGGTQRIDLGGELGKFEVSVFPDGNGFFIKRLSTSSSIAATFVPSEAGEVDKSLVMVYSETLKTSATGQGSSSLQTASSSDSATNSWGIGGVNWKTVFQPQGNHHDQRQQQQPGRDNARRSDVFERNVVVADSDGNSFICRVDILKRFVIPDTVHPIPSAGGRPFLPGSEHDSLETESVIASFPCSPGLYGKTNQSSLAKSNGVVAEGVFVPPSQVDKDGCAEDTALQQCPATITEDESIVSAVFRGRCTFQSKSNGQARKIGSNGVIVINSQLDELFLMSGGDENDHRNAKAAEPPATVLVTGSDGEQLLAMHQSWEADGSVMVARIVLESDNLIVNQEGEVSFVKKTGKGISFPIVKASPDTVQIFVTGGWGVHAVDRPVVKEYSGSGAEQQNDWQLFLLQHQLG